MNSCLQTCFLMEKQSWEHAIATYKGPDPLDHWYGYVCWYEGHAGNMHGVDFRELLERCLTLFEHSEFYKQDPRMIRLWIKYIDIQQHPLQYYQVLYQRGVGRQVAVFFISWARYYESINALNEAESVYNLGFQEKAQPYAELLHAHSKFLYTRSASAQVPSQQKHQYPQQQIYYQHGNTGQVQMYSQHMINCKPHISVPSTQICLQPQSQFYHQPNYVHQNHYLQNQSTTPNEIDCENSIRCFNTCNAQSSGLSTSVSDEQKPSTNAMQMNENSEETEKMFVVGGIILPKKFTSYSHNNNETWTPALFLEEPSDPCRRCHYAKNLVYPDTVTELSPEELRFRRFIRQFQEDNGTFKLTAKGNQLESFELKNIDTLHHSSQTHLGQNEQLEYNSMSFPYQINTSINAGNESIETRIGIKEEKEEAMKATEELIANNVADLEEQIVSSTIRFNINPSLESNQTKTIKIKFKKDPQNSSNSLKKKNYSAYTVEGIYQQEVSPMIEQNSGRKNYHTFHPYSVGQTSTPKTSSKRNKIKIKKVHFRTCSNSNSSSADNTAQNYGNGNVPDNITSNESVTNATFNDNANYSFSSAVSLDNSNCSLTSAVSRLNFRDATAPTNVNAVTDSSTSQENLYFTNQHDIESNKRCLQKALDTIERHLNRESIDPFNSELCRAFLTKLEFPKSEDVNVNYKIIQTPLPKIANTRTLTLPEGQNFSIEKEVGRGSYGSVYKALDINSGNTVALKFQKPPNTWEIYICDQVLKRITSPDILPGLMDISIAVIAPNASLIATEFSPYGSLLDINNKIRQATTKVMHESLVMHFSSQICSIISHLHINKIIHADIKPDNFLLMRIPSTVIEHPSLRLIDFGCAIDMTLFPDPEATKFRKVVQTDGFTCIEMQEGRPWSYETDLFCIAGTVHVMLFGEYMQLQKRSGIWDIKQKLPRYLKKHVWTKFFNDMLNINCENLPNLRELCTTFDKEASLMDSELQNQIRTLSNILHKR